MSIYENIAADATVPREVRARALLRLAGCLVFGNFAIDMAESAIYGLALAEEFLLRRFTSKVKSPNQTAATQG